MALELPQSTPVAGVREALSRLHTSETLPALYDRATRAVCDYCGFDRGVLFRLEGFEMIPVSVYFSADTAWADEFQRVGQQTPMRIDHDIVETEMISTRAPMFVPNAQSNPRGFKPLVEHSRTRSYCAAPLAPENVLIGFLHADCYFQERDVTAEDRDVLGAFAEGLGFAIQRTTLRERVDRQRSQINRLRSVIDDTLSRVSTALTALEADADDSPSSPVLTVPGFEISRREEAILRLTATGAGEDQVAKVLGIPRASVTWHLTQLMRKLGADDPAAAVARWQTLGS
jgi:GAF domain-containing protein/DNA-binding CsgD family transcriptional regulator